MTLRRKSSIPVRDSRIMRKFNRDEIFRIMVTLPIIVIFQNKTDNTSG